MYVEPCGGEKCENMVKNEQMKKQKSYTPYFDTNQCGLRTYKEKERITTDVIEIVDAKNSTVDDQEFPWLVRNIKSESDQILSS